MSTQLRQFLAQESAAGTLLILAAIGTMALANSSFSGIYQAVISFPFSLHFESWHADFAFKDAVKDGLMVLFFLYIGMELKHEMMEGVLSSRAHLVLPLGAACGGMIVPALLFCAINLHSPETIRGWAIASATDIAFALALLQFMGRRIAPSVRVFLLALAIFDDLGAIVIIALFYSNDLSLTPLLLALPGLGALYWLNGRILSVWPYMLSGIYLCICLHEGGLHTTLAGVLVGLSIPLHRAQPLKASPAQRTLKQLQPWVNYAVLPLFAFSAAGVDIRDLSVNALLNPLPLGVMSGLFLGKQLGVYGACWLLVRLGLARWPQNATRWSMYVASILAGIGFTMSLFIGLLAFDSPELQAQLKLGVLAGSLLSALGAYIVMRIAIWRVWR